MEYREYKWDEPPYCAHQKGLDDAYKSLSDELLKQIHLAVMYAVNGTAKASPDTIA